MVNLLGDLWTDGEPDWAAALAMPDVKLHLYGKAEPRPGRKMGHLIAVGETAEAAAASVRARGKTLSDRWKLKIESTDTPENCAAAVARAVALLRRARRSRCRRRQSTGWLRTRLRRGGGEDFRDEGAAVFRPADRASAEARMAGEADGDPAESRATGGGD